MSWENTMKQGGDVTCSCHWRIMGSFHFVVSPFSKTWTKFHTLSFHTALFPPVLTNATSWRTNPATVAGVLHPMHLPYVMRSIVKNHIPPTLPKVCRISLLVMKPHPGRNHTVSVVGENMSGCDWSTRNQLHASQDTHLPSPMKNLIHRCFNNLHLLVI